MTGSRPGGDGRRAGPSAGPPPAAYLPAPVPGPHGDPGGCGCDLSSFDFVEDHADELDVVVEVLHEFRCARCGLFRGVAEVRFFTADGHARLGFECSFCGAPRAVAHVHGVDVWSGGLGGDAPQ